ncbi:MAG: putative lipid II flippase FtsW [Candidatus Woesebacteria bacterium]|nr:MAG: putative lipid II flippase FtsW [Candidatus Woesebacteria bacterium]
MKKIDKKFFWLILSFVVVGLIAVADVSAPQALNAYGDKFFLLRQQVVWAAIGVVALIITMNIHYSFWEKVATPFFFLSVFFLLIVLLPHLSFAALGARRWISIGSFNFQPSELVKLSLAMYLAKIATKNKGPAAYFVPLVIVTGLIMLQPDLGTTLVVATIGLSQIFISGMNLSYFFGALVAGALGTIGLILASPYRRDRLLTFFETTSDPLGKGYHIRQILLALGSGGIFGVGLGASRQKYLFLPEASTDSIFAVIAEELGLIGSVVIIFLYAYLFVKGVRIAKRAPDKFSKILAIGIVAWISGQAFLNIASMVSFTPLTGIPLPFLSYGGTSLVMILSACGILLNISKYETYENAKH